MIIIMIVIATYVLINWLIPLFFSCLIVLVLQPLLAKEIKLLKIENIFLSKCLIVFNYLLFIGVIIAMIIFAVIQIYTVLELLPNYLENLYQLFSQNHYIIDATKYLDVIYSGSMSIVESISTGFITGLIAFIMKIPSILFDLIFSNGNFMQTYMIFLIIKSFLWKILSTSKPNSNLRRSLITV